MYSFLESSETTRETICVDDILKKDIDLIIYEYKKFSRSFLEWFMGFSAGSFCFIRVLTQYSNALFIFEIKKKDPKILYYIKKNLGFGQVLQVSHANISFWVFRIVKKKDLLSIFGLFKFQLTSIKNFFYFFQWLSQYQIFYDSKIFGTLYNPQLAVDDESYWLNGYIFSKTHFIIYSMSNLNQQSFSKIRLIQKLSFTQKKNKRLLNKLSEILKSNKLLPIIRQPNGYQLEIDNFFSFQFLFFFFNKNGSNIKAEPLKKLVFLRWWRICLYQIEKRPLTYKGVRRLKKLFKNLNKLNKY
uniref:Putative LAGLIDADG homing endonuclease n=1 Tax=Bryopsis plumosa TaxID=3130 RepID=A0A0D6E207_BRYPL|nr:putative LAGLIDADG homing endonuclease [Bryopsis plumosa]CEO91015.1 putative LAGLIDADG homing endonuclease [Bryopsis plumosa]